MFYCGELHKINELLIMLIIIILNFVVRIDNNNNSQYIGTRLY